MLATRQPARQMPMQCRRGGAVWVAFGTGKPCCSFGSDPFAPLKRGAAQGFNVHCFDWNVSARQRSPGRPRCPCNEIDGDAIFLIYVCVLFYVSSLFLKNAAPVASAADECTAAMAAFPGHMLKSSLFAAIFASLASEGYGLLDQPADRLAACVHDLLTVSS